MGLYLLPNVFSDEQPLSGLLPPILSDVLPQLDGLFAESERSGRRYLLKVCPSVQKMRSLPIVLIEKALLASEREEVRKKLLAKEKWGVVSDAGLPCLADPGSDLVAYIRKTAPQIPITAIPGPSSIFLALMLSGFSGQCFSFAGYLPREQEKRAQSLKRLEKEARERGETKIWIETPYRNQSLMETALQTLVDTTLLCVASNITFEDQVVTVLPVKEWKRRALEFLPLKEQPTIFLLDGEKKA